MSRAAISVQLLIRRDWFRYSHFTRSEGQNSRQSHKQYTSHRSFFYFFYYQLIKIMLKTEIIIVPLFLPVFSEGADAFEGSDKNGSGVVVFFKKQKHPRTQRRPCTLSIPGLRAESERLHLNKLLGDVCVAGTCSRAFPWGMERQNLISHRWQCGDKEITFKCISLKKNQYDGCGEGSGRWLQLRWRAKQAASGFIRFLHQSATNGRLWGVHFEESKR